MTEMKASRTLLKSPPELWAECSDAGSLARHLNQSFGEIRITKLEPETAVAWEGEEVSGTVRLEPSGWGTRVILTALSPDWQPKVVEPDGEEPEPPSPPKPPPSPPPEPEPEPLPPAAEVGARAEPQADSEPAPAPALSHFPPPAAAAPEDPAPRARRRGLLARLWGRVNAPPPGQPYSSAPPDPEPVALDEPPVAEEDAPIVAEPVIEVADEAVSEPAAKSSPEPEPQSTPQPEPVAESWQEPVGGSDEQPRPEVPAASEDSDAPSEPDPEAVLTAALDSLGQAHHRPFSRA